MGDSPKWVKSRRRRRERKKERLNDGDNNGQATHGARKHAWRTQAAWAKIISHMGVSPKWVKSKRRRKKRRERKKERLNDGNNNGQATHGAHKLAWRTQAAWAKSLHPSPIVITESEVSNLMEKR